jgi:hypothetical protein
MDHTATNTKRKQGIAKHHHLTQFIATRGTPKMPTSKSKSTGNTSFFATKLSYISSCVTPLIDMLTDLKLHMQRRQSPWVPVDTLPKYKALYLIPPQE